MTFQEKIRNCENTFGPLVHLSDVIPTEIFAALGYDYIWLDMEHTTLTCEQVHHHMLAARNGGSAAIVRVPVHDLTYTKRIMEMGPDGIIFPMVTGYEDAKELLSWTLYPPLGARGCGPKAAVRYGIDNEPDFYKNGHVKTCRFIQVELESAAREIEKIVTIPHLDGVILGMHDLSGSIGRLGDVFSKENLKLAQHTVDVCRANNITVGTATFAIDKETLTRYHDMGMNMITTGSDYDFILKLGRETLETMQGIMK
ncbi:MAG: aldolase [Clostridia bacterium]|nr:aldolase [Clostridia bacterium]